ncbi:MAG: Rne/Rng family ribonuclease [Planctomycetes bacterium]|nr:Rne/Rng family ribonuclease [Planctomycetota bacterium]
MAKRMLVNVKEEEESRVAILDDDHLEELYVERHTGEQLVGNIYKGRVVNIEPAIQACFVDIGMEKNGFLHATDIVPTPELKKSKPARNASQEGERRGRRRVRRRDEYPIADLVRRGQEILVQVTKERLGEKGPGLTHYISLPGRYLVMVPLIPGTGVSRKIGDEEERRMLKEILLELGPAKEHGFIVRTAGMEQSKRDMQRDLDYLTRLWSVIESRAKTCSTPALVYQESDVVIRTIRDIFSSDIDEVIVDSETMYTRAREFLEVVSPRHAERVKFYAGKAPLFHRFQIEREVENVYEPKLKLKTGGSIVIEQTEALVAIDVNSGKFTDESDPEETAFKTNAEAAVEVARQIRLRDLGGVIVIDFIDMRGERNRKEIERILFDELRKDRAKTRALRMSRFCIVEMTRQRMRSSLRRASHEPCPLCHAHGYIKNLQSQALYVMRQLRWGLSQGHVRRAEAVLNAEVASYLQNMKRRELISIENLFGKEVRVATNGLASRGHLDVSFFDRNGRKVVV